jgi:hypothetical protein
MIANTPKSLKQASGAGTGQERSNCEQNGEDALLEQELECIGRGFLFGFQIERPSTQSKSITNNSLGFFDIPQES